MQYLRKANESDIDLIFEWANEPLVRANSFNSNAIPYDDHIKWYNRMLNDDNILQFILMEDDVPVGQIRLNVDNNTAEIGYSIAADYRGKGYGHSLLRLAFHEIKNNHPEIKYLVAKVKPDNAPSKRLFENEGYKTEYISYALDIEKGISE